MDDLTNVKNFASVFGWARAILYTIALAAVGVLAKLYFESNVTVKCSETGRAQASQGGGVVSAVTETMFWRWYCEPTRAAEKIEAEKVARRPDAQPEAPTPAAPAPVAQSEAAKPVPAAPPAPALATPKAPEAEVAVVTPPPSAPPHQANLACGDGRIPDAPQLASTWDQQMCAIIACGGGAEAVSDDVILIRDWGALAGRFANQACMTAARQTLGSQALVNSLYAALDRSALPERDPSRTVCRRIRIALGESIKARQERLAKVTTSGCAPAAATAVPADLRAFTDAHGLAVVVPD